MGDPGIDAGIRITLVSANPLKTRTWVFYSIRTAIEFLARERWSDWIINMADAKHRAVFRPEKAPLEVIERQMRDCWLKASSGEH
jgi:hypothetical protein